MTFGIMCYVCVYIQNCEPDLVCGYNFILRVVQNSRHGSIGNSVWRYIFSTGCVIPQRTWFTIMSLVRTMLVWQ